MLGKIDRKVFDEVIYPHLGKRLDEVIVPPLTGVDTGAIDLGDRVLVVKTDPVFIVPQFGMKKASWFAVHILASDVMTSGIPPRYALLDLNLPPSMTDEEFREMWVGIHEALLEIGVMVVGGHTGRYEGVNYPMVGGFTMIGIGEKEKLGHPSKVKPGDYVIVTKGPAIEATGLLTNLYPEFFRERMRSDLFKEALDMYWKMSCWKDGLIASQVGIHMMHDATEGGLWNALVEISEVTGKRINLVGERLFINPAVREVTRIVGIDPFSSISEGTMVIVTDKEKVKEELLRNGIEAEIVGRVESGEGVYVDGKRIEKPSEDPFWRAFFELANRK
ncbi:AIR synthase related protein domain protein [Metallosphaera sedula]|uniref:AIR synthase related protein domain protein n=2 Tax=Metallosphaera sedula TaxID=43687 RepID=A4YFC4_METS5|nr:MULTISPECIES: AIR synthase family protein [Metallosphaera]ABP95126.1 AIR synthase related protein domain protein [Metallosphaera sedula DSM 5348]AIM27112.1 AIR synthase related protein domain protein [Metallosphaera sedula]AKV74020.1 AIR synthase [Metallosphaera sedula]AKV76259.1 AIR synthase [Metallosphaera sedula]AKV78512.1 AIR synthase [Metallosphaera sedula]